MKQMLIGLILLSGVTVQAAGAPNIVRLRCLDNVHSVKLPDGSMVPYSQVTTEIIIDLTRNEYKEMFTVKYFPPLPPPTQPHDPRIHVYSIDTHRVQPVFPDGCTENCTANAFAIEATLAGGPLLNHKIEVDGLRAQRAPSNATLRRSYQTEWESCGDRGGCTGGTDNFAHTYKCSAVWK